VGAFGGLILLLLTIAAYFLPSIIAWQRKHNLTGVLIVNFLLGWTVIGWIISLVMACGARAGTQNVTVINQAPGAPAPLFDPHTGERLAPGAPPPATPAAPAPSVTPAPAAIDSATDVAPSLPPASEPPPA
jgi:hypothetical protein